MKNFLRLVLFLTILSMVGSVYAAHTYDVSPLTANAKEPITPSIVNQQLSIYPGETQNFTISVTNVGTAAVFLTVSATVVSCTASSSTETCNTGDLRPSFAPIVGVGPSSSNMVTIFVTASNGIVAGSYIVQV